MVCIVKYSWIIATSNIIFNQRDLNLRQRRRLEFLKDYDITILFHPSKANVVTYTLSQNAVSGSMTILPLLSVGKCSFGNGHLLFGQQFRKT